MTERSPARTRRRRRDGNRSFTVGAKALAALTAAVVVAVVAIGWITYRSASAGITKSDALAGEPASPGSDQNILIMGLDSRRDQHGRPLPPDIYNALHAGGEDSGDGDADALIVLHVPAGGAPATAISIPRDDYVDLAGCPTSDCRGKIKEAYSLAYQRVLDSRDSVPASDHPDVDAATAKEQTAREAGRRAEIGTVKRLLQIPIDHFVEVTLAGFFQIARVVEPITVCLYEDTSDRYYSGADFHRGVQQISATQAMAFVRQRRDADDAMFTDLDRSRRQQAFIASVVVALRRGGVLSDLSRLRALLNVAKQNIAVDAGLDLDEFVRNASAFADRPVALYTLPVTGFGETSDGAYVNYVDPSAIRSIVQNLVTTDSPATPTTTEGSTDSVTLDVVNASGRQGKAAELETSLATGQFSEGQVSTADSTSQTSTIAYGPGARAAATELADQFGMTATESGGVARNRVQLTVGTDFSRFDSLNRTPTSPTTTATAPVTTVPATGTGTQGPTPTDLTRMTADGIPCVK
ncbi:LCP family protein [Mycobacterium sp. 663a-19]|uniref:LCP family protein n=1 Tax=Mycobacterium sp. 663a-19 TaxID=2986148 RepID=UPI002D1E8AC8|nr:LCP family protein [Mycobacterium sp. 663a-19]MEB3982428.1 LCP family protein [Mycobacterium sp. 663a-19]